MEREYFNSFTIYLIFAGGIVLFCLLLLWLWAKKNKNNIFASSAEKKSLSESQILMELSDAVIVCDKTGVISFINSLAMRIFGDTIAKGDNFYNNTYFKIPAFENINKKSGDILFSDIDFSLVKNQYFSNIHSFRCKVSVNLESIVVVITDISDSLLINDNYSLLNDITPGIIDFVSSSVSIYSGEGRRMYVNMAFRKAFGITDMGYLSVAEHTAWNSLVYSENFRKKVQLQDEGEVYLKVDFRKPEVRDWYHSSNNNVLFLHVKFKKFYKDKGSKPIIAFVADDVSEKEQYNQRESESYELIKRIRDLKILVFFRYFVSEKTVQVYNEAGLLEIIPSNEFFKKFVPQDVAMLKDAIQKLVTGKCYSISMVLRSLDSQIDGGNKYWNTHMTSVIEDGKIIKIEGLCNSITYKTLYYREKEKHSANKSVIQNNLVNLSTPFIYTVSDGLLFMPERNRRMFLSDYLKHIDPVDLKNNAEIINSIKAGKNISASITYRYKTLCRWHTMQFSISPSTKDKFGNVLVYNGVVLTSPRWNQLVTSEESDKLLKSIINSIPCMFTIKDPDDDFRYLIANNVFCNVLDIDHDLLIMHNDYDIFGHNKITEGCYKKDYETLETGAVSYDVDFERNGTKISLHINKVLYTDTKGKRYLISSALNLTKLNSIIEQLKDAKNNAERSDRLKSAFLANMSHEIRTPLNAICGFSSLIGSTLNPEKQEAYSKLIVTNSDYLLKIIGDILDLSKIEAGYVNFMYEDFDISKLFNDICKRYNKRKNPGVELIYEQPYPYCVVNSDIRRIKQIVTNFLSNALKFTTKGYVKIGYKYQDNGIYIYVEDTGTGISEDNYSKIFCRFEKLDPYVQGSGLGLALTKSIVECAGGYVDFKSQLGKGSKFWAWIPCPVTVSCNEPIEFETKETLTPRPIRRNLTKMLVAEDDDGNFALMYAVLRDNYRVERAVDGEDVVKKAISNQYGIIFMDIKMPKLDGLEATKLIRESGVTIPIVAVTAYAYETDREAAIAAGCNDFITKPVNIDKLKLVINRYGF